VVGNGFKKWDGFTKCEPVVAQGKVGGKAIGNRQTEARIVTAVIIWTGTLAVMSWVLEGIREIEFTGEDQGDARTVRRRVGEDRHGRLSDKRWSGAS